LKFAEGALTLEDDTNKKLLQNGALPATVKNIQRALQ
jgi:hypothetical protein